MLAAILVLSGACLIAQVATSPHTVSQVVDFWVTNTEHLVVPFAKVMATSMIEEQTHDIPYLAA